MKIGLTEARIQVKRYENIKNAIGNLCSLIVKLFTMKKDVFFP